MNNLKQEISAGQKWKPANHKCHENNDTQLKQSRYPDNHTTVLHSTATCLTRLTHHLTFCSRFPGEPGLASSSWCSSYTCSRKEPLAITARRLGGGQFRHKTLAGARSLSRRRWHGMLYL